MFGWLFSKKSEERKEEEPMTVDEKMIKEAEEDGAETKAELDESVGEQEHLEGEQDEQSAKDRVDESIGAEEAEEEHEEISPKLHALIAETIAAEVAKAVESAMKARKAEEDHKVHEVADAGTEAYRKAVSIFN